MGKLRKYSLLELGLIIAIAIAVILRILNLGSREFWYDEVLSLLLCTGQKKLYTHPLDVPLVLANYKPLLSLPVENGFGDILQTFEKLLKGLVAEPHPPLFYLGQHIWLRLFGNSVMAMRSLPALFSIGTIFCSYGLGRKLLGYRGGLLLAAALGLNPFFLFHSLNVRMYSGLVFWTVLSGWATLELVANRSQIRTNKVVNSTDEQLKKTKNDNKIFRKNLIWSLILVLSVIAGFMTFYYFGFWIASLGFFVVLLDFAEANNIPNQNSNSSRNNKNKNIFQILIKSKRWQRQSLLLSGSVIITIPWLLWGTRQQLNNADLGRFESGSNFLETSWQHLEGILTTLGINILIGDWASILSPTIVNIAGFIAIFLIVASIIYLWREQHFTVLLTAICFSLLPLSLMVIIDVISGKFTVGFGFGRSLIFILPGCLLLLVTAIMKLKPQWQTYTAIALLICYLSTSVADFSLRNRQMFHNLADIIEQQPNTPTLIIMNSTAWGHVLRLAYYLPEEAPIQLLARKSHQLNKALVNTLNNNPEAYKRLIWLDSDRPVWGSVTTEAQKQVVQKTLAQKFELETETRFTGTWELDHFDVLVYRK
ncbi:conserved membrane hypothetical protein [Hyella patelloides LEGE 07179]|uniref:Glycosyltransferase RgtA/B/C/D-like domain-containing protein n=1 Tax=Hyella patelloides LEGE 07179 TaxID=945734 RepID=A0A563VNF9_9CYAN|nr:glycosyltransferase family 39 protein [Hyella patelloides]VEP12815.1 conserved membrane hypothetical protein [Hyella patelloides LEGE 07179]